MNNENPETDLERVGSFSVPPPSFRERALGIAATAERIIIKIGKVGLVLVVIATAALAWRPGKRWWTWTSRSIPSFRRPIPRTAHGWRERSSPKAGRICFPDRAFRRASLFAEKRGRSR